MSTVYCEQRMAFHCPEHFFAILLKRKTILHGKPWVIFLVHLKSTFDLIIFRSTARKVFKYGVFPGPYFRALGLNMDQKKLVFFGTFHAMFVIGKT